MLFASFHQDKRAGSVDHDPESIVFFQGHLANQYSGTLNHCTLLIVTIVTALLKTYILAECKLALTYSKCHIWIIIYPICWPRSHEYNHESVPLLQFIEIMHEDTSLFYDLNTY